MSRHTAQPTGSVRIADDMLCHDCGGPLSGKPHIPKACIEILKWKVEESERELRVAEETVAWLHAKLDNGNKPAVTGKTFRRLLAMDIRMINDVSRDIEVAASFGDSDFLGYATRILLDAARNAERTIDVYYVGLLGKSSLSGPPEEKGKHWMEEDPPGIIESVRTARGYYESVIKALKRDAENVDEQAARELDSRRVNAMRRLAVIVKSAKKVILERDPAFWTPELEEEFKEWLEFEFM